MQVLINDSLVDERATREKRMRRGSSARPKVLGKGADGTLPRGSPEMSIALCGKSTVCKIRYEACVRLPA